MDTKDRQILYLFNRRSLYIGKLLDILTFSKACSLLVVSLGDPVKLIEKKSGSNMSAISLLIPAGAEVSVDAGNQVVAIYMLDVLGEDFKVLQSKPYMNRFSGGGVNCHWGLENEESLRTIFNQIHNKKPSSNRVFALLKDVIGRHELGLNIRADQRVKKAVAYICKNGDRNPSIDELAEHVCLSVSYLNQLFKKTTGSSIQYIRAWYRLYRVATFCGEGVSLSDAILKEEFSNYSQFSRSYEDVVGIPLYNMFSENREINIVTMNNENLCPQLI